MLWTSLLLDTRVVIYVDDPYVFYTIMKGLNQLMYPLEWVYPNGIIESIDYLDCLSPFCFGIIKSKFPDLGSIKEVLENQNEQYLMLDIISRSQVEAIIPIIESPVLYPNYAELKNNLDIVLANGSFSKESWQKSDLKRISRNVKKVFFRHTMDLLIGIENAWKKTEKTEEIDLFQESFLGEQISIKSEAEMSFMTKIVNTQVFSSLFDEMSRNDIKNLARALCVQKNNDKLPYYKKVQIDLSLGPQNVFPRLRQFKEFQGLQSESILLKTKLGSAWSCSFDQIIEEKIPIKGVEGGFLKEYGSLLSVGSTFAITPSLSKEKEIKCVEPIVLPEAPTICSRKVLYGSKGLIDFLNTYVTICRSELSTKFELQKEGKENFDRIYRHKDKMSKSLFDMNSDCFQFYFMMAIYFKKYKLSDKTPINACFTACKFIPKEMPTECIIPSNFFCKLIRKLDVRTLRSLLKNTSELVSLIRDVYEEKTSSSPKFKKIDYSEVKISSKSTKDTAPVPTATPSGRKPFQLPEELKSNFKRPREISFVKSRTKASNSNLEMESEDLESKIRIYKKYHQFQDRRRASLDLFNEVQS